MAPYDVCNLNYGFSECLSVTTIISHFFSGSFFSSYIKDPSPCPKIANDTHLFSQPPSSMPWGRRSTIWDPGGPHQTPQTAIDTPKATQFSLSTLNVGKDPISCPKIAKDTHLFSQPTSSMPLGRRSTIWDPGGPRGPHQTFQTAIHTPKTTQFPLSTLNIGKGPSSCPKNANDTPLFSQPTSSMPLGHRSTIWDPGGPHPTPQTSIHTPKTTQFALSTLNVGQVPSSCLKIVNDTHPFSHPTSTMSWGRRSTIWDPMGPHTAIHSPKATQFALSTLNVGQDPSSCLKIANDTPLFSQPTSSMPWGRSLTIWDPRGPHQSPQTAKHTLKATQLPLSTLNVGKDLSSPLNRQ